MTMIAALTFPDLALLVADSVCCYPGGAIVVGEDGHAFEDHKLIALPGGFVLTLLGSLALRKHAEAHARGMRGFDEAVAQLPAVLRAGAQHLGERVVDAPLGAGGNTLVLAGWSAAKGTMAMAAFKAGNNFEPQVHGPGSFWRNPESPGANPYAVPADRDALVNWAHGCVRGLRVLDPKVPVGGKLRLAEVTRTGCTVSVAGDLGLPSLAAVVLSAALVACGGGDAVVVQQLSAEAATAVFTATAAGPVSFGASVPAPDNQDNVISISVGPFASATRVRASASFTANVTANSTAGQAAWMRIAVLSDQTGSSPPFYQFGWLPVNGGGPTPAGGSLVYEYALPASTTATFALGGQRQRLASPSGAVNVTDALMSVEVIKR